MCEVKMHPSGTVELIEVVKVQNSKFRLGQKLEKNTPFACVKSKCAQHAPLN